MRVLAFFLIFSELNVSNGFKEEEKDHLTISKIPENVSMKEDVKYFLYEVNFGEGFNLRRDVYMRVATTVKHLRDQGHNYILVLPPWGNLYHWKDRAVKVPWRKLFHIGSLDKYVPMIEFEDYLSRNGRVIDGVVYLQRYVEGWKDGKWEERFDVRNCLDADRYYEQIGDQWKGFFYTYQDVRAKNLTCLSLQGESKTFTRAVLDLFDNWNSIFVDRAETILHDRFGSKSYWETRRSMRYAKNLVKIADDFIRKNLDANNASFNLYYPEDWRDEKEGLRVAIGGRYISVHLRRGDFLRSHSENVPSIPDAVEELLKVSKRLSIKKSSSVQMEAKKKFTVDGDLSDAEVSIIDQIIASKAMHFIGTHSSTFSYRIREDREIMHFPTESTFNDFCKVHDVDNPLPITRTSQELSEFRIFHASIDDQPQGSGGNDINMHDFYNVSQEDNSSILNKNLIAAGSFPEDDSLDVRTFIDHEGTLFIQVLAGLKRELIIHDFIDVEFSNMTDLKIDFDYISKSYLIVAFNGINYSAARFDSMGVEDAKQVAILDPLMFEYQTSLGEMMDWNIFEGKLHLWYVRSQILYYVSFAFQWDLD
ncbi:hypothetical protein FO519_000256 [Halicephalobus sp. NKZ332]|nr:hypothetical protein FO519_000256 [Halicephalobus sp. NKZ332]